MVKVTGTMRLKPRPTEQQIKIEPVCVYFRRCGTKETPVLVFSDTLKKGIHYGASFTFQCPNLYAS